MLWQHDAKYLTCACVKHSEANIVLNSGVLRYILSTYQDRPPQERAQQIILELYFIGYKNWILKAWQHFSSTPSYNRELRQVNISFSCFLLFFRLSLYFTNGCCILQSHLCAFCPHGLYHILIFPHIMILCTVLFYQISIILNILDPLLTCSSP